MSERMKHYVASLNATICENLRTQPVQWFRSVELFPIEDYVQIVNMLRTLHGNAFFTARWPSEYPAQLLGCIFSGRELGAFGTVYDLRDAQTRFESTPVPNSVAVVSGVEGITTALRVLSAKLPPTRGPVFGILRIASLADLFVTQRLPTSSGPVHFLFGRLPCLFPDTITVLCVRSQ
jgi:hypothetical protein